MSYPISIPQIEKILGKRRLALVEVIEQDSECTDVILRYPYTSSEYGETVHAFGHDHFASWDEGGTLTVADYRADILGWFDSVSEDPNNRNYKPEITR